MTPTVRMYATEQQARAAVAELISEDFGEDAIRLIAPMPGQEAAIIDAQAHAGFIEDTQQRNCVRALTEGRWIVSVRAKFYRGQLAIDILDDHDPLNAQADEEISNMTLSDWLGMPAVINKPPKARLISSIHHQSFGFKLLSSNPAPLSSKLGLKLLSDPHSKTQLSRNPAPLSSKLGLKLLKTGRSDTNLSRKAAPLSSAVGAPVVKDSSVNDR